MGKQTKERRLADNQARAVNTMIKTSCKKLVLVADLIREMRVEDAILQLRFCCKRVAKPVLQTLESAVANAENNHGLDIDNLYIKNILIGKSVVMKRFRARARGRGARIRKPFSRVTIIVEERDMAAA